MEMLPEAIEVWLCNYGVFAIFGLLALGIVALPIPEETLLVFSGLMVHQGTFALLPTFLAAFGGSVVGITGSYLIGHTGGLYLIKKYGGYVGFTDVKMAKAHNWFEKYGKWVLFIGYFIPGVRHFTGVFAGISDLEYHHFALYAYVGAFFWVLTFICLGYFFGNYHQAFIELIESNVEYVMLLGIFVLLMIACVRKRLR
jgi:membrane protein DedA with SNARE-associated domain